MKFKGYYTYNNDKNPTEFTLLKNKDGKIYGEGEDNGGQYSIEGTLQKSGRLDLTKYYMGSNTVTLYGRYITKNDTLERLYGCWEMKDVCSGDFEYNAFK